MKRVICLVLLAFLFLAATVKAQHCSSARGTCGAHTSGYQGLRVRVVKQQAAYVAPTYNRAVFSTYSYPQYYYSVGAAYDQALLADAIAFRVLAVQRGLAQQNYLPRYQQQGSAVPQQTYQPPAVQQSYTPQVQQQPCPDCQQQAASQGAYVPQLQQPQQALSVDQAVAKVVQASCVECHAGANGIDLRDTSKLTPAQWGAVYYSAKCGDMPKGRGKLSSQVIALFRLKVKGK